METTTYRPVFHHQVDHNGETLDAGATYFKSTDDRHLAMADAWDILHSDLLKDRNGYLVVEQTTVVTTTSDVIQVGRPDQV